MPTKSRGAVSRGHSRSSSEGATVDRQSEAPHHQLQGETYRARSTSNWPPSDHYSMCQFFRPMICSRLHSIAGQRCLLETRWLGKATPQGLTCPLAGMDVLEDRKTSDLAGFSYSRSADSLWSRSHVMRSIRESSATYMLAPGMGPSILGSRPYRSTLLNSCGPLLSSKPWAIRLWMVDFALHQRCVRDLASP